MGEICKRVYVQKLGKARTHVIEMFGIVYAHRMVHISFFTLFISNKANGFPFVDFLLYKNTYQKYYTTSVARKKCAFLLNKKNSDEEKK